MQGKLDGKPEDIVRTRVAIYARYSSDLQRSSSIEDQTRICRSYAEKMGWEVVEKYVRSDEAKTGRTMAGRGGLLELIEAAKSSPRPFEGIIVNDTSRLGRYLPDVLLQIDELQRRGVFFCFASQGLDSRDPNSRILQAIHGVADEQYLADLGDRVHRGQAGRFAHGYNPGSVCYGYRNIPDEDPLKTSTYGRPVVIGVREELEPGQAKVVLRIFELYAAGTTSYEIVKSLNAEGVRAPGRGRCWSKHFITRMLSNERYRGIRTWNKSRSEYDPATGKTKRVARRASEWMERSDPSLQIVPDELWARVTEERARRKEIGQRRFGGLNRTGRSRQFLFSGLLACGECGGNYVIVVSSGGGRYGCYNRWASASCGNKTTIAAPALEDQLISALLHNLDDPRQRKSLQGEFVKATAAEAERRANLCSEAKSKGQEHRRELAALTKQRDNLVDAITKGCYSASVDGRLKTVEARIQNIEQSLAAVPDAAPPSIPAQEFSAVLDRERTNLAQILTGDRTRARKELQQRIKRLTLTPASSPNGRRLLMVGGSVELLCAEATMLGQGVKGLAQHCVAMRLDGLALRNTPPKQPSGNTGWGTEAVVEAQGTSNEASGYAVALTSCAHRDDGGGPRWGQLGCEICGDDEAAGSLPAVEAGRNLADVELVCGTLDPEGATSSVVS